MVFMMNNAFASTGDICYVKQYNRLLWQKMSAKSTVGSKCVIYNGSFVPVYEGKVGTCMQGIDCGAVPRNVDLGRRM